MIKILADIVGGITPPADMPIPKGEFDFSYPGIFLLGFILGILTVITIIYAKKPTKNKDQNDEEEHK